MINKITWKTYFVFFCFNLCFIPLVRPTLFPPATARLITLQRYFFFREPNGHKLEVLGAIFTEAHEKGENPAFAEKRWPKHGWVKTSEQNEWTRKNSGGGPSSNEKSNSVDRDAEHVEDMER